MEVFKILNGFNGHALHFVYHRKSYLRAIIALDTVVDGRAVGGIRLANYRNEAHAVEDACQLARAMSFKSSIAGLPCGGAKTVIFKHPTLKRAEAYRALGRAVEELGGLYHSGLDLGTTMKDLQQVASQTNHVSNSLDFGKHTARGVIAATRAAIKFRTGADTLREVRVAIQGLGNVGMELAKGLHKEGAQLVVADSASSKCAQARREFGAEVVSTNKITYEPCDVFAPCAGDSVITTRNLPRLACDAIVGSANNILSAPPLANELMKAGITFVPGFVANAGALIMGVTEIAKGKANTKPKLVDKIYDTSLNVLRTAKRRKISTIQAAETIAAKALKR